MCCSLVIWWEQTWEIVMFFGFFLIYNHLLIKQLWFSSCSWQPLNIKLRALDIASYNYPKFSKGTELNRCKKVWGASWMKLLNSFKKYMTYKSVQPTIRSISHTHALYCLSKPVCNDTDGDHKYGATIQSCKSGEVWWSRIHCSVPAAVLGSCQHVSKVACKMLANTTLQLL